MGGRLWFEELVSGHGLLGSRVASWLGQPPVHGGPLSSRVSDSFVLVWVESGGVLGVHSPLCSSVVLLELLSFSSVGDVKILFIDVSFVTF
ncbi:hypothetical protein HID58_005451 [Brassica napus]|uniref:Uncharacterized protein n=1 Tax=Brassica napus TaxID=3708 RepID=A0ABQ8EBI4_BRANA|nr:hypothetical protein HID58_005451 [Brassica napus]